MGVGYCLAQPNLMIVLQGKIDLMSEYGLMQRKKKKQQKRLHCQTISKHSILTCKKILKTLYITEEDMKTSSC